MRHLHSPDNLDLRRFRMELSEVHAGSSSKSGHGAVDKSNISHTKDLLLNSGINVSDIEPGMLDRLPSLAEVEGTVQGCHQERCNNSKMLKKKIKMKYKK